MTPQQTDDLDLDTSPWTCGDCGTTWPHTVRWCENTEADRAAVLAAKEAAG